MAILRYALFQHELNVLIKCINISIILFSFVFRFSSNYLYLSYSESLWMACLCLLGGHGVCLCSLLRLPLSLLHVCAIETGVEYCSGVGVWPLLSSSSSCCCSSTKCSPPVAGSMSAKAQVTLCLGISLSDGAPSTLGTRGLRSSCWLLFIRCWSRSISKFALSDLQIGRRITHFPLFTPTPFSSSLT